MVYNWRSPKQYGAVFHQQIEAMELHAKTAIQNIFPTHQKTKKKIKVAIDSLGACATLISKLVCEKLNIPCMHIYPKLLSSFPRKPEPNSSSLKKFSQFVRQNQCDVGFAFDPDADRLVILDEKGSILSEEYTLLIVAKSFLPTFSMKNRGRDKGNIVVNYSTSMQFANWQKTTIAKYYLPP